MGGLGVLSSETEPLPLLVLPSGAATHGLLSRLGV